MSSNKWFKGNFIKYLKQSSGRFDLIVDGLPTANSRDSSAKPRVLDDARYS